MAAQAAIKLEYIHATTSKRELLHAVLSCFLTCPSKGAMALLLAVALTAGVAQKRSAGVHPLATRKSKCLRASNTHRVVWGNFSMV